MKSTCKQGRLLSCGAHTLRPKPVNSPAVRTCGTLASIVSVSEASTPDVEAEANPRDRNPLESAAPEPPPDADDAHVAAIRGPTAS
eukprot:361095-Chlamydomonas_euryale.AAC.17